MVLNDGQIYINTVDLSAYIKSFEFTPSKPLFETTGIDIAYAIRESGNSDFTFTVEFYQSFAASATYITLYSLIGTSTAITLELDESEDMSATNPRFNFSGILESFPIGGSAGEVMMSSCTFQGNSAITLTTSEA